MEEPPQSLITLGQDSDLDGSICRGSLCSAGAEAGSGPSAPVSKVTLDAGPNQAPSTHRILLIWGDFRGFAGPGQRATFPS